jgi:hypothetical protein
MASTAASIILIAGGMTFVNEWYQNDHAINWRIPIATFLAAAVFDGLAKLDNKAAVGVSIMVLIGAFVNKVNGKSIADVLNDAFTGKVQQQQTKKTPKPEGLAF